MRAPIIALALVLSACAAEATDDASDGEAESADAQLTGKADAPSFDGLYKTHASTHHNGDITNLQLGGTDYIRTRCYHASCALPLPETDTFDTYRSSAGKTYVRFYAFTVARDATGNLVSTPVVADVYEIAATSYGVKLRKSYTTRWFSLYRTTATATCTATGGSMTGAACACPSSNPVFVPGAGGCLVAPGASEDGCDSSDGLWRDDDAAATGTYCSCALGFYDDASGSCAAI